jgi:hypothetical protein
VTAVLERDGSGDAPARAGLTTQVVGGVGGTTARLEDLGRAALALRGAADRLADAAATLAAADRATWVGPDVLIAGQHARTALAPLLRGPGCPAAAAERVRDLARSLDATAGTYARAESSVTQGVRGLGALLVTALAESPLRVATGALVMGAAVGAGLGELEVHRRTGRWVGPTDLVRSGMVELGIHGASTYLRALRSGIQLPVPFPAGPAVEPLARRLGTGQVVVTPVISARSAPTVDRAPRGTGDVLRGVEHGYDGQPGTVAVTRLDHPDGTRSWLVQVPGTEEGGIAGSNPMDMSSNLRLIAGQAAASSTLVVAALRMSGVPRGEPVMLAGHSQGGMAAMAVAGDPAVTSRYTITHVLTAGSPVAGMSVPASTQVLSLENRTDPVPALDGAPNPDEPHRTTVRVDPATSADPRDRLAANDLLASHGIDTYARTADRVETELADDPSVSAWLDSARTQVYGPEGTTASVTEYQGVNVARRAPGSAAGTRVLAQ